MKRIGKTSAIVLGAVFIVLAATLTYQHAHTRVHRPSGNLAESILLRAPQQPWEGNLILRVATFNVWDLYLVSDNRAARMRAIGESLTKLDADLVGFQESFIERDRELLLTALSGSRLKHHVYFPSGTVGSGLLICSAWPVKEHFFHPFTLAGPWWRVWEGDWWAGKGIALARIETPAGILDFYNTHAQAAKGRPEYIPVRRKQMIEISKFMRKSMLPKSPALLVGDINCRIGSEEYQALMRTGHFSRAMNLDSSIDHIFFAENKGFDFRVLDTTKIERQAPRLSDHPGFLSTIQISPRSGN